MRDIVELLKTGAREHPGARFLTGYATYTLMKFGRYLEAFEVANGCTAAEWWCGLWRGYVFHGVGSLDEAEGLDTGRYLLRLRTWWQGQEPPEAERAFEVR